MSRSSGFGLVRTIVFIGVNESDEERAMKIAMKGEEVGRVRAGEEMSVVEVINPSRPSFGR